MYKTPPIVRALAGLPLALALTACGGEWSEYEPDTSKLPADTSQSLTYPAGPYGTKTGDTITNLVFPKALFDPGIHCKGSKTHDIYNTGDVRSLSLGDLYNGSPLCRGAKRKQFLWLAITAGW